MKLNIEGTEYDLTAALERPTLFLLREMKLKTGYGMKSLMEATESFEGKSEEDIIDDPDALGVMIALIWVAKRHAGENITFEQAGSFDLTQMEFIQDAAPEALEIPKDLTAFDQAAPSLPPAVLTTSKTSSIPSLPTFSPSPTTGPESPRSTFGT